jgi:thiamine biosynthesis lipoprotein
VVLLAAFLSAGSCDNSHTENAPVVLNGFTMGTTYTITINEPRETIDLPAIKKHIDALLDDLNAKMSTYLPDSELSRINQSDATEWINISGDLYEVIKAAIHINALSDGAFDITIGPLVNLWGFGPDKKPDTLPDDAQISMLLGRTGTGKIHLHDSPKAIKKDLAGIYLDLSGIAKGYAVDRIADLLQQQYGIQNCLVEIGGEIRASGVNPHNRSWRIGIEKPLDGQRSAGRIISLVNTGMATSGDYRNYFETDGVHYSHIIDPLTGKPVTHQLVSVTVLHPEAMIADAWGTALLVLGPEKGMDLANRLNLPVLFIVNSPGGFNEIMNHSFRKYIGRTQ